MQWKNVLQAEHPIMVFSLFALPVEANEGTILNRHLQGTIAKLDPERQSISIIFV